MDTLPPEETNPNPPHDIRQDGTMLLRVSPDDVVLYANHALARYIGVLKTRVIGAPIEVLRNFFKGELAECIRRPERGKSANRLATDPDGRVFEVKMYSEGGVLDIIIDDVTDLEAITRPVRNPAGLSTEMWDEEELRLLRQPERRYISVSHTRLWNLGNLSDTAAPAELRVMMNAFVEEVADAIAENTSAACTTSTETVLGIYGAPRYFLDHGLRAVKSACDQMQKLDELRNAFSKQGHELPPAAIALASGEAVLATIGVTGKQEFSAVGKPVNTTERLSTLARPNEILLTEETLHAALNCLPPGWQSIRAESEDDPNLDDVNYNGAEISALPESLRKVVYLIGPGIEDNIDLVEFFFCYLYCVKLPEERKPQVILSVVRPQSSGSSIELDDENVVSTHSIRMLGKYRLIEAIGRGGMGQVWRAQDRFGNSVAIKVLNSGEGASDAQLRRFKREAEVMAKLPHRNICRIYEIGEFEGVTFISMEFVAGVALSDLLYTKPADEAADTDLSHLIRNVREERSHTSLLPSDAEAEKEALLRPKESRILPFQQTLHIIGQICDALQFAHEHGVLHRDLKPGNILLREDGEPLVADFGLAKLEGGDASFSLSLSGHVVGTIENMAPEQAISSKEVDERADVYAIGTILYQLLTGRRYFEATGNLVSDAQALQTHQPLRPRFYNKNIDSDLEVVTLKALRSDRNERYRNVAALKADLDRYVQGELISAKPVTAWALVRKSVRRNKLVSAVIATSVLILVGFGLAFIIELDLTNKKLVDAVNEANARREESRGNAELAREKARIAEESEKTAQENARLAAEGEKHARTAEVEADVARKEAKFVKKFAEGQVEEAAAKSSELRTQLTKQQEKQDQQTARDSLAMLQEDHQHPSNVSSNPETSPLWQEARNAYVEPYIGKNFTQKKPEAVIEQINHTMALVNSVLLKYPTFAPAWFMKGRLHLACMELDSALETFELAKQYIPPDAPRPQGEDLNALIEVAQNLKKTNREPFQTGAQLLNDNNTGVFNYTTIQILNYFADHSGYRPGSRLSGNVLNRMPTPEEVNLSIVLNSKEHPPKVSIQMDPDRPDSFRLKIEDAAGVDSLAPLRKIKISQFTLHGCPTVDWPVIDQMGLDELDLAHSKVEKISVPTFTSQYAKLRVLRLADTGITNITALAQMPMLEIVDLARTPVSDLSPLRGKRLKEVSVCGTAVTDIAPIAQNYLRVLDITDAPIKTLAPLRMSLLETLILSLQQIQNPDLISSLKGIKSLKVIRTVDDPIDQSSADFWKRYNAGEFGTPAL
ncbi:MAG: protein kinase [Chthoniobacterales bacterium]